MSTSLAPTPADLITVRQVPGEAPATAAAEGRRGRITRGFERYVGVTPSTGSSDAYLDGLRAVAVIAVLTMHVYVWSSAPHFAPFGVTLDRLLLTGGWGVDLFFVLSGFLLSRAWFIAEVADRPPPGTGRFFVRRLVRIVPAYYVSILVLLVAAVPLAMVPLSTVTGSTGFWNIGLHLSFLHHVVPLSSAHFASIGGVYWTLTMEFLFYLSLPLFVLMFRGRWNVATPAICLALVMLWTYLSWNSLDGLVGRMAQSVSGPGAAELGVPPTAARMRDLLSMQFPTWLFAFAIGIAIARLVVRHRAGLISSRWLRPEIGPLAVLAGALLLVVVCELRQGDVGGGERVELWHYLFRNGCQVSLGLILFGLTIGPEWLRRPLESLPMRYLGWISYGVYLFHVPLIIAVIHLTPIDSEINVTRFVVLLVVVAIGSLLAGTISWLFIERPFILAAQRRLKRVGVAGSHRRVRPARPVRPMRWRPVAIGSAMFLLPALIIGVTATDHTPASTYDGRLGQIRNVAMVPDRTGEVTPAEAAERHLIARGERRILRRCGARYGVTEGLTASSWSGTASVFTCRDAAAAERALTALTEMESRLGFRRIEEGPHPVLLFGSAGDLEDGNYSYGLHARYRSDRRLVGVELICRDEESAGDAVRQVVQPALERIPATP